MFPFPIFAISTCGMIGLPRSDVKTNRDPFDNSCAAGSMEWSERGFATTGSKTCAESFGKRITATMSAPELNFGGVHPAAASRALPFFEELISGSPAPLQSIYVTGSAVTPDFNERTSDVNSLVVVPQIDMPLLEFLGRLGRRHGRRGIHAPLLMSPQYIERSLDVFPVEFLDLQLVSHLVWGQPVLPNSPLDRVQMRMQCERELKGRLITLRQGFIRSLGDRRLLRELLVQSLAGLIPLLRGILFALSRPTPRDRTSILTELQQACDISTDGVEQVIRIKNEMLSPALTALEETFSRYYETVERLTDVIDAAS